MEKFDSVKMIELIKVVENEARDELTLVFQENKTIKIVIQDGNLVSSVSG